MKLVATLALAMLVGGTGFAQDRYAVAAINDVKFAHWLTFGSAEGNDLMYWREAVNSISGTYDVPWMDNAPLLAYRLDTLIFFAQDQGKRFNREGWLMDWTDPDATFEPGAPLFLSPDEIQYLEDQFRDWDRIPLTTWRQAIYDMVMQTRF